jgi:hypothetical protein
MGIRCIYGVPRSRRDRREQVAEFVIDVFGAGDGLGDFCAEELAVALAQTVENDAHGGFGDVEFGCEVGVRGVGGATGEAGEELVEVVGVGVFGTQAGGYGVEECERPGAVEGRVGRGIFGGEIGELIERGGEAFVTAGSALVIAEVGEVVVEGAEQKGTKSSAFATGGGERFEAEEAGEEPLHGIFCVV